MAQSLKFTEKEKKIRRNWLAATYLLYIGVPILCLLLLLLFGTITPEFIGETSAVFIGFWWIYHCAYKKHGTALLTFALISAPIYFVRDIIPMFTKGGPLFICIALFFTIIEVWYFVASLRLRKVNARLEPQTSFPGYNEDVFSLREITSFKSLEICYQSLLEKWPEHEKISSKEYEHQKTILEESISKPKDQQ